MELKQLTEINGISGNEKEIRNALLDALKEIPEVNAHIDRMGNVIAERKGTVGGKRVLFAAHMDEVGLIVRSVTEDGFLRIAPAGGIDPRVLVSKHVQVGDDRIPGVIGCKPIHLQSADERKQAIQIRDLYVDIGAKDKAEAEKKAPKGTYIAFDTDYVEFGHDRISAKALDDRVGCYTMLRLLEHSYRADMICAFTVQEEVGTRGAQGAGFGTDPDIGIILEGTTAGDMGNPQETTHVCSVGDGVTISFMDGASIGDRELYRLAWRVVEDKKILAQPKRGTTGGNDGGRIQRSRGGIPTLVLSVPCRYIHSPSSVVRGCDVEAQYQLAKAMMEKFGEGDNSNGHV